MIYYNFVSIAVVELHITLTGVVCLKSFF